MYSTMRGPTKKLGLRIFIIGLRYEPWGMFSPHSLAKLTLLSTQYSWPTDVCMILFLPRLLSYIRTFLRRYYTGNILHSKQCFHDLVNQPIAMSRAPTLTCVWLITLRNKYKSTQTMSARQYISWAAHQKALMETLRENFSRVIGTSPRLVIGKLVDLQ